MHKVHKAIPIDTSNLDNQNYESILACRLKKKKKKGAIVPPIAVLSGQDSVNLISFWILRACMSTTRDCPFLVDHLEP